MIESQPRIPDATDDSTDGVEPIEMLVQLAEDGEIDPWDIDIVSVTEEFLAALDEGDIRESARALFYASVLLRLKSQTLLDDDSPEEPHPEPDPTPEGAFFDQPAGDRPATGDPIDALETEIDRRIERKDARGSPETLDELVRELREAERGSWWKESREYETTDTSGPVTVDYRSHPDPAATEQATPTVTDQAHDEQLEATITAVEEALKREFEAGREAVLFREIRDVGPTPVRTFLGALFLAHRGQLQMDQDEPFGDLWLVPP